MPAQFMIDKPMPVRPAATNGQMGLYRDASGVEMKWSAPFPLPAIGDRVYITLNSIGWAHVKGYFEEAGYLGVMTLATRPPAWLRDQLRRDQLSGHHLPDWRNRGIGCEFGAEITLTKPTPKPKS